MHRLLLYQSLDIAPKQRQLKDRLDRPRPTASENQHLQADAILRPDHAPFGSVDRAESILLSAAFQRIAGHGIRRIVKLLLVQRVEGGSSDPVCFRLTDPLRHCTPGFSHAETFRNQGLHG